MVLLVCSDFNYDFHATTDGGEEGGVSVFLREGENLFHTYSTTARGVDLLHRTYNYLDLTPLGRQESWEEPAGRSTPSDDWLRYHDQYGA